jgi:carbamoyltransferase
MGMAAYGKPIYYDSLKSDFIKDCTAPNFELKENVHRGIRNWRPEIYEEHGFMDLAASIQKITEEFMCDIANWAHKNIPSKNLVLMGGVALNCVANEKVARLNLFDQIWIMPNPGDAGSSLGAALAHTKKKVIWEGPYLGTNIDNDIDTDQVVDYLIENRICGLANGRAEFGPRALGNRSLLADPRDNDIKIKVNDIKRRQRFRPFAPIIMEQYAHQYFDMPVQSSPYMQYTSKTLYPKKFPAICHVDNTSRVQTLNQQQNPIMYEILSKFYDKTGCPMMLNTSLNIKGQPLVNNFDDAIAFQNRYVIKVF